MSSDEDEYTEFGHLDDEALQELYAAGQLGRQSGKQKLLPTREPTEMVPEEVEAATREIAISDKMNWLETFMLTSPVEHGEATDDFGRENAFYDHTLGVVAEAVKQLKANKVPMQRPRDYYAEMLKTDDHMRKIREQLLSDTTKIESSEKARKQRLNKKFGKQIQTQVLLQRQREKTAAITEASKLRKGLKQRVSNQEDMFDVDVEDDEAVHRKKKSREYREAKYGFGGKKNNSRFRKNDSDNYISGKEGFSVKKNRGAQEKVKKGAGSAGKAGGGKKAGGGAGAGAKRLGKSRRPKGGGK